MELFNSRPIFNLFFQMILRALHSKTVPSHSCCAPPSRILYFWVLRTVQSLLLYRREGCHWAQLCPVSSCEESMTRAQVFDSPFGWPSTFSSLTHSVRSCCADNDPWERRRWLNFWVFQRTFNCSTQGTKNGNCSEIFRSFWETAQPHQRVPDL